MRFPQLEESHVLVNSLGIKKKRGGINENCLSLKGFITYNTNKEKAGSSGKALITLHVEERCLGRFEMAINRTVSQTFQADQVLPNTGVGFLCAQLVVGGTVVPTQAVN